MSPDHLALIDIATRARLIAELCSGYDDEGFIGDSTAQDAVSYRLLVIGEAVKRLTPEFRASHTDVNWAEIAGLRDLLVHAYHRISIRRLWAIAHDDVPTLLAYIEPLLPVEPE